METPHNTKWVCVAIIVVAVPVIWLATIRRNSTTRIKGVVVTVDTNGVPELLGFSLANSKVRDGVFQAMGAAGVKITAKMPAGISPTNQTQVSNVIETLKAVNRAGLFATNSAPNPYE